MTAYKDDLDSLAKICSKCGGQCCIGDDITVSAAELKNLKEKFSFESKFLKTPHGKINAIKGSKDEPCCFIGKIKGKHADTGCTLPDEDKPLSCRLFPLTFIMKKHGPKFYLSGWCPYAREAVNLKEWIKRTIRDARKELKTWTEEEKMCKSYIHKKYGRLIELKDE